MTECDYCNDTKIDPDNLGAESLPCPACKQDPLQEMVSTTEIQYQSGDNPLIKSSD